MTVRLVQVSDIHFGREDALALDAFDGEIERLVPDGLLICGDLTQHGRRGQFRAAAEWLSGFTLPILAVPGNHDTPQFGIVSRVAAPFARYRRHMGEFASTISIKDMVIAGLNTARGWQLRRNWAEGAVHLGILDALLKQEPPPQILVCHHPIETPADTPWPVRTRRGRSASIRLAGSSIEMVLTGHLHVPSVTLREHGGGAYLAINSGTLSTRLRNHPASFNLLEITDKQIRAAIMRMEEGRFIEAESSVWDRERLGAH
jgi:3',5'-cyclic AMP phosphodiesterase CpdA